jgi:hypothetical protein
MQKKNVKFIDFNIDFKEKILIIISYFNTIYKYKITKKCLNIFGLIILYSFNYSIFLNMITKYSPEASKFALKLFPLGKLLPTIPILNFIANFFAKRLGKSIWFFNNVTRLIMYGFKYRPSFSRLFSTPMKYNYYYLVLLDMLFYIIVIWCEFFFKHLDKIFFKYLVFISAIIYIMSFFQAIFFSYPKFPILSNACKTFCRRSNLDKKKKN